MNNATTGVGDLVLLDPLTEENLVENLRKRFMANEIYTYIGNVVVSVNPYQVLPIYSQAKMLDYSGRHLYEMPPHIYATADAVYRAMKERRDQVVIITGESGAGKTESTKKVIQYFASITSTNTGTAKGNIEDQVIQANPMLEAFGNAKTIRNDNSSRFGKFIRVQFSNQGKIAGADIESYLLEKSRVVRQQPGERCFHIFYQLLAGASDSLAETLLLNRDPASYTFLAKSTFFVDEVNDALEFKATRDAMTVMGFSEEESLNLFKTIAAILHFGNIKFGQSKRSEYADSILNNEEAEIVSHLLGLSVQDFTKALLRPRIKTGNEYTIQGRTLDQVVYSVEALSKATYERMFKWLVGRINKAIETKSSRTHFIGVLDIAGFEIFKFNSFEQLLINYTNERLQQFFNHHMFDIEQEEYKKEGIDWDFIDFGLDLQPCINLIEKSMGVLALLDEECLFPKATDTSFAEKLHANHHGRSENYSKPGYSKNQDVGDFQIHHYAGTVTYSVDHWIDKNKDPLNDNVVELLQRSTNAFIADIWTDRKTADRRKKGSQFVTVGQLHKEQLTNLMETLLNTDPHFVRCIIPNELKKPMTLDAKLTLHQLRCNGVIEGIRICRKGFPNRILFQEFRQRYSLLAPGELPPGFMDGRKAAQVLVKALQLDASEFRIGNTKVFFRAGVLGRLEEARDAKLATTITEIQAYCRGLLTRRRYRSLQDQLVGIQIIQRNVRSYLVLRQWPWWKLFTRVKPLLNVARAEEDLRQKEEALAAAQAKLQKEEDARKNLESEVSKLDEARRRLETDLEIERDAAAEAEERAAALKAQKDELDAQLLELEERLDEEQETNTQLSTAKRKLEVQVDELRKQVAEETVNSERLQAEKQQRENTIRDLEQELSEVTELSTRLNKEKKTAEDQVQQITQLLQVSEDKVNNLGRLKTKLESQVADTEAALEAQRKETAELDKAKRQVEATLKSTTETLNETVRQKQEVTNSLAKKTAEALELAGKLEEADQQISVLQRRIRELELKVEELEDDLQSERAARAKVEKQRDELAKKLEDLEDRLEEAGGATAAQIEVNKQREQQVTDLKNEVQTLKKQGEEALAALKKKTAQSEEELQEKLETALRAKSKLESDSSKLAEQSGSLGSRVSSLEQANAALEKQRKQLEESLQASNSKLDAVTKSEAALKNAKAKLDTENAEYAKQVSALEANVTALTRTLKTQEQAHDEAVALTEQESKAKTDAQSKLRDALGKVAQLQETIEEDEATKARLTKEAAAFKAQFEEVNRKLETEVTGRLEELDASKRKLETRLTELQAELDESKRKNQALAKTNATVTQNYEDANLQLEKFQNEAANSEKKQRKVDQQIAAIQAKYDDALAQVDQAQKDSRTVQSELLTLRGAHAEAQDQIEGLKRENRRLQEEISTLTERLGEGGKSSHDLEKAKKKLEYEKAELQQTLDDTEAELTQAEQRAESLQMQMNRIRLEHDQAIADKDEQIEEVRKSANKQVEPLRQQLEDANKINVERQKTVKKLEGDVAEANLRADAATKANAESQKLVKKLQQQLKDSSLSSEAEERIRAEQRDAISRAERKAADLSSELEELRGQLEQAIRLRKSAEAELHDAQENLESEQASRQSLYEAKRKLEAQNTQLQEQLEEIENEGSVSSEKVRRAQEAAEKAQADLAKAHEEVSKLDKERSSLDRENRDLKSKLEEADAGGRAVLKKQMQKLESRIKELETELETEQSSKTELVKSQRKNERKLKELQFAADEEHKNSEKLQDQLTKANAKLKSMRRQVEEAEEEKEQALTKSRKYQRELEELEDKHEHATTAADKLKQSMRRSVMLKSATDDDDDDSRAPSEDTTA
eukprot:m.886786 g.886786  ORF g.886786 m.886786 type:complete len:1857 (-) comp59913_c0_seq1:203-5773(-)